LHWKTNFSFWSLKTTNKSRPSSKTRSRKAALNRPSLPHEEAVTLLRGHRGKYCALVADIVLRGRIDGWEVAQRAREIDPDFPIIYMTGAKADQWPSRGVPNSILMEKPFAPAQLVTAVSQLLNGGPRTP
jgi:CheY-like chemotaxis protein